MTQSREKSSERSASSPRSTNTSARKDPGSQTISFGLHTISWVHQGTDWHSCLAQAAKKRSALCSRVMEGGGPGAPLGGGAAWVYFCAHAVNIFSIGFIPNNSRGSSRDDSVIKSLDQDFQENVLPRQDSLQVSSGDQPSADWGMGGGSCWEEGRGEGWN